VIADHGGPILPQPGGRHRLLHAWAVRRLTRLLFAMFAMEHSLLRD